MEEFIQKYQEGEVILIDKPLEWTSFDVVNYIRQFLKRQLGLRKIKLGHAGTLDPLASGLLILCSGRATKRIDDFQGLEKVYECTMDFSASTPSFDMESEPNKITSCEHLTADILTSSTKAFMGDILQIPPTFSAVKIGGVRAYEMARKDEEVKLNPKQVNISEFSLLDFQSPKADFRITCSKGTYIRSLARDLGEKTGCGAYLTKLRRTKIGDYDVKDAMSPLDYCTSVRDVIQNANS